ncbi:MAG: hypothetical protein ACN6OP_04465 [Pseudomonadales bacterium]
MAKQKTITVGELRHDLTALLNYPDDTEVSFGAGDLSYYRLKSRLYRSETSNVPRLVQVEFSELYEVTLDPDAED